MIHNATSMRKTAQIALLQNEYECCSTCFVRVKNSVDSCWRDRNLLNFHLQLSNSAFWVLLNMYPANVKVASVSLNIPYNSKKKILILLILRQLLDSRSIFIKKHDSGINLLISHLARGRVENIEFQLIKPPILCQCAAVKAQRRRRSTHCDHDEESKHHAQHDVQIIGQASSPQRTQNGGQASDGASHTLAEPCRHSSQMQSSFWVVFLVFVFFSSHCVALADLEFSPP